MGSIHIFLFHRVYKAVNVDYWKHIEKPKQQSQFMYMYLFSFTCLSMHKRHLFLYDCISTKITKTVCEHIASITHIHAHYIGPSKYTKTHF